MKKGIIVSVIALIFVCLTALCACSVGGGYRSTYSEAEKYTAGSVEFDGSVDTLHVYWKEGKVVVKTHKENTVLIEEADRTNMDEQVHWLYKKDIGEYGNVLYVRYAASGKDDFGEPKKTVTITIPEVDDMYIGCTIDNADLEIDTSEYENTMREVSVTNTTGSIRLNLSGADTLQVSGKGNENKKDEYVLHSTGSIGTLGINSSYASVDLDLNKVRTGENVGSVFNDFKMVCNQINRLTVNMGSKGKQELTLKEFNELSVKNNYEDVVINLDEKAEFTLTTSRASAENVSVLFDGVVKGNSTYTVGSGKKKIKAETEGKITVKPTSETPAEPSEVNDDDQNENVNDDPNDDPNEDPNENGNQTPSENVNDNGNDNPTPNENVNE